MSLMSGVIFEANGTNGVAILAGTSATVANQGGLIAANGQNGVAISGQTVNVTGNTGAIQAGIGVGITGGVAISAAGAGGTADVTNSGTIQASGIAIVTDGLLTLNNTGSVTSGGRFAVVSNNGDVNVTANAGTIEATDGGGNASAISALQTATVNNSGTISAVAAGGIAIEANTATVSNIGDGISTGIITADRFAISGQTVNVTANTGLIEGFRQAIFGTTATVNNSGTIRAKGVDGVAISGPTVHVTGNTGTIEAGIGAGITGGIAIFGGTADVTTSGAIQASSIAIVTDGLLTLNNTGSISSGGQFAVVSNNGDVNVNQNVAGSTGTISAIAAGGIAIQAAGTATVGNIGDGNVTGIITADKFAIKAQTVNVTANSGLIEATGASGHAIDALTATIGNSGTIRANAANATSVFVIGAIDLSNSGTIQATDAFGTAIFSSNGPVSVTNSATGVLLAGNLAVGSNANAMTVTNAGLIEATSANGAAVSSPSVTVLNNLGTIRAAGANATAIDAFGGTATVTNAAGGVVTAGKIAIHGTAAANVDNAGTIQATASGAIAISSGTVATVTNAAGGQISGQLNGISARTVDITANAGIIEATGGVGGAITATDTVTVNNAIAGTIRSNGSRSIDAQTVNITANAGVILATGTDSSAILANNVTVNNVSGGKILAAQSGIKAGTANVTNATGATISGGVDGINVVGASTVTNAGTITGGTHSVSFNGAGTSTLILQTGSVLNGDALGSSFAGATNKLILQGSGTVDNHFTSFNTLDFNASGAWVWNSNSAMGATAVNSGTLAVDNVLASPVSVSSGGTLAGHGIISGDISVASGGTVAPGAAVLFSTLNVLGNVSFQPGSIFRVNADATGKNDKLAVTGSATLTGGTVNVPAGGSFAPSSLTTYKILTTSNVNGLGGTTFSSVTTNLAFLTPSLSYTANDVTLTLATATGGTGDPGGGDPGGGPTGGGTGGAPAGSTFGFAKVALTRNQRAVATALDRGPVSNPLVIAVLNQTVAGARQAFDALSGEVFGSVHNVQAEEAQFARSAMLGRMRQSSYAGIPGDLGALGFGGPALAYAADNANATYPTKAAPGARGPSRDLTFWAQGLGGWGHADSDGNAASLRSRFGGFLSGVDARFGETWRAGFVAGYMRSDLNVNARASSAGIDSVQLGGYAAGQFGAFNVRGGASYSLDSIDTSRAIIFPGFADKASARFHGNVGQVFGEVGYGMAFGSVAVEPLAGLAYVHVRDGSFLESGGVAALSGASANENTGYSFVGVRAATAMPLANGTVLIPRGMLQWQHAFGDVTPATALAFQGTGAGFSVAGIPIARDTALVEAGFDWRFATQAKLGAFYQGELAAHAQTHAVKGAFTWDF